MTERMSKRVQIALAHLNHNGFYDNRTFPPSEHDKYLSATATEIRTLLKNKTVDAGLAKFNFDSGKFGYVWHPQGTRRRTINELVERNPVLGGHKHYWRELARLEALSEV